MVARTSLPTSHTNFPSKSMSLPAQHRLPKPTLCVYLFNRPYPPPSPPPPCCWQELEIRKTPSSDRVEELIKINNKLNQQDAAMGVLKYAEQVSAHGTRHTAHGARTHRHTHTVSVSLSLTHTRARARSHTNTHAHTNTNARTCIRIQVYTHTIAHRPIYPQPVHAPPRHVIQQHIRRKTGTSMRHQWIQQTCHRQ